MCRAASAMTDTELHVQLERHAKHDAIDLWGAALEHGNDDEVDRLAYQSRADPIASRAAIG
jgi:hypothetical protein